MEVPGKSPSVQPTRRLPIPTADPQLYFPVSLSAVSSESLELYPASQSSDTHPSHLLSPSPSDIGSYMPAQLVSTAQ